MVKKILSNQLIRGSAVLFIGATVANFGNYLYHLLMGRMLGPKDYGALTALISLIYLISIITGALSITVVKFVTIYKVDKKYDRIRSLFIGSTRFFILLGFIVFLFFYFTHPFIGRFLNLEDSQPIKLIGLWAMLTMLSFINDGILRGLLNFNFISLNAVLGVMVKIPLAWLFVHWGLGINGAIWAIIIGSILPYLNTFYPLRVIWVNKDKKSPPVNWKPMFKYTVPVLMANLGLISLFTSDIILAKHFLPNVEAGLYASLAVLGKIIFFASGVIPTVMFPMVSEKYENNQPHRELINQSLNLVIIISIVMSAIYFLAPGLIIRLLYGSAYISGKIYLGYFAVFISLYSLVSLLINYFLSIKKYLPAIITALVAGLQIVIIVSRHQNIWQIVTNSIILLALLLTWLLVYYWRYER